MGNDAPFRVSDDVVSSLKYEHVLGDGTFKTVHLVSGSGVRFAVAVERLRSKTDAKEALRGIGIVEEILAAMKKVEERDLVEKVYRGVVDPIVECARVCFGKSNLPESRCFGSDDEVPRPIPGVQVARGAQARV